MSPQNIFLSFLFTTVLTDRTIQLMKFLFALSPWTLVTDRLGLPSSSVTYFLHLFPHLEIISIMLLNSQRCCEDQRNDARKMFRTDPPTPPLNVCSDFSNGHYPYGMSHSEGFSFIPLPATNCQEKLHLAYSSFSPVSSR